MTAEAIFLFGTLCHAPLRARVLGQEVPFQPAECADASACTWLGAALAMLSPGPGGTLQGICLRDLPPEAAARLAYYAESQGLRARTLEISCGADRLQALAFDAPTGTAPGGPWDHAAWTERCASLAVAAVDEVMLGLGMRPAAVNARRRRLILARAAARLRAAEPAPTTLRRPTTPDDFDERRRHQPYANFFAVEEYDFRHRRFDGSWSEEMNRAAFLSGDAATVLPYDAARDAVLLIEQFRVGPYARGDSECWSVEAIAGLVDPGETPEQTARREAVEEAGVTLGRLHRVYGYYSSPGAKAEFLYSYVGEADLHAGAGGLGGLAAEGEDIRAHVVPFDRAMALLDSGEIANAPLILTLLWLARNRDRLRAAA
ncbi:NUDIX domain-containing protein [Rhodovulum adriaticum]|uniref:ADP-ribose pyrophosphatase n=1 Tax=Rhodovulum adriaticum TaxID=35804 RepID=A0A4R2NPC4_RHOAD|nr:NUDIX domain-containing protein [Rhodovulum adriaticum]MBK1634433.1 hypothetical protein [Rhodovulum adriaticum]TCP23198.1 nudix-type nucleoside diphosphatase (YffH/AdpP family) [Rhodovulum adriaticum]